MLPGAPLSLGHRLHRTEQCTITAPSGHVCSRCSQSPYSVWPQTSRGHSHSLRLSKAPSGLSRPTSASPRDTVPSPIPGTGSAGESTAGTHRTSCSIQGPHMLGASSTPSCPKAQLRMSPDTAPCGFSAAGYEGPWVEAQRGTRTAGGGSAPPSLLAPETGLPASLRISGSYLSTYRTLSTFPCLKPEVSTRAGCAMVWVQEEGAERKFRRVS